MNSSRWTLQKAKELKAALNRVLDHWVFRSRGRPIGA
jgi:hypothetical protein